MEPSQHPLDTLVHDRSLSPSSDSNNASESHSEIEETPPKKPIAGSVQAPPALSPDSIQSPALLIDRNLCVIWQNRQAAEEIWHHSGEMNTSGAAPKLLDVVFDPEFQSQVKNWRQWAAFFIHQFQTMLPAEELQRLLDKVPDRQKDVIAPLMGRAALSPSQAAIGPRLRQVLPNGRIQNYDIKAIDFNEGRLLVFELFQTKDESAYAGAANGIERRMESVRRHRHPVKRPFTIMAASLNNTAKLNLEMMSDEYSILVSNVCQYSMEIIEGYGGIFNKHQDSGFFAYFLPMDDSEESGLTAIECCLDIKERIADLSREWKVRKSWPHDIELNMGIHKTYEHIGTLNTYCAELMVSSGSALRTVTCLSRWSQGGQILASKSLFTQMPKEVYSQLRFGILKPDGQGHQVFIQKCFMAIKELPGFKADQVETGEGLEDMAVTQLFGRQV